MTEKMRGIILAAGRGSRMGSSTETLPKCRTLLNGKELIQWQLDALRSAGIEPISIVRGYLADTFDYDLKYFENDRWAETNMVMSLLAACEWLEESYCIVSYSDIVYSANAVCLLKKVDADIAITYDPNWLDLWSRRFSDPLSDAETFQIQNGCVREIGNRASSLNEIEGQYMGLLKFSPVGWKQTLNFVNSYPDKEKDSLDMTMLLQGLIRIGVIIKAVPIKDRWLEVDSQEDLVNCKGYLPLTFPY